VKIELLKFQITPPERTQEFIKADEQVWDPWLQQQRGYLRKAYQIYPNGIIHLRIFWATQRDLAAASKSPEIPAIDVRLRAAFLGVYQRLP